MAAKIRMKDLLELTPLRTSLIDQCTALAYLADLDLNLISKIYSDVLVKAGCPSFPAALTEQNIKDLLFLKVS
jgi:hypothetical protein